jgi:hypothetical protein
MILYIRNQNNFKICILILFWCSATFEMSGINNPRFKAESYTGYVFALYLAAEFIGLFSELSIPIRVRWFCDNMWMYRSDFWCVVLVCSSWLPAWCLSNKWLVSSSKRILKSVDSQSLSDAFFGLIFSNFLFVNKQKDILNWHVPRRYDIKLLGSIHFE